MLITSMPLQEETNKVNKELKDSRDNDENNQYFLQKWSSLLTSMMSNQETRRYGTVVKLGLIPMEGGIRSYILTSSFKVDECGKWKLESEHHYGARSLSLPDPMGNALCHPSLWTKPRSTPKISTSTSHWTGQYITNHLDIWIDMGGLNPWPNYPAYAAPPLSKIRWFYSMDMTVNLMTAHQDIRIAETSNPLYWNRATQPKIIQMIMGKCQTAVSLQWDEFCVDAEVWDGNFFTSPNKLHLGGSMGRIQGVIWKNHQGQLC